MAIVVNALVRTQAGGSQNSLTLSDSTSIAISQVSGLDATLAAKLNDSLTDPIGSSITALGEDLNVLTGIAAYGLITADLQKLANVTVNATEINYLSGVSSAIQTQLNAKYSAASFGSADQIIAGTGSGTASIQAFSTVLGRYRFSDLALANASLNANSQKIINLATPTVGTDAATKAYVDGMAGGTYLPLSGGDMTGDIEMAGHYIYLRADLRISAGSTRTFTLETGNDALDTFTARMIVNASGVDMNSNKITGLAAATVGSDATNKTYVDNAITGLSSTYMAKTGGDFSGAINMNGNTVFLDVDDNSGIRSPSDNVVAIRLNGSDSISFAATTVTFNSHRLTGLTGPSASGDAATKGYVDTAISGVLSLSGGNMTGDINTAGHAITNLPDPSASGDAATKGYVDTGIATSAALQLPRAGGVSMSGSFSMGSNKITSLATPTVGTDAATKGYVDTTALLLAGGVMTGNIDMDGLAIILNSAGTVKIDGASTTSMLVTISGSSVFSAGSNIDVFSRRIVNVTNPSGAQDAATKNYTDTQDALKLSLSGGVMSGDIDLDGNDILNIGTFSIIGHEWTSAYYRSGLGGASFHLNTAASPTVSAPTYSFIGATNTGMFLSGAEIVFSVAGAAQLGITATQVNAYSNKVVNVADPTSAQDAATKAYVDGLHTEQLLGSATGIDLRTLGTSSIYTVPSGETHVITKIIVATTTYTPGAGPTNPVVTFGDNVGGTNLTASTTLDWGGTAGAANMCAYVNPKAGAVIPTSGNVVRVTVATAAAGTFSALTGRVYVMGFKL